MKVAITGATGYIGQRLVRLSLREGFDVVALSRRPIMEPDVSWQPFDLADDGPLSLPNDVDAIFHLAADTHGTGGSEDLELNTAKRLIEAAKQCGAKFLFISSQAARHDAPTRYGRTKWRIEKLALNAGGIVIRPGQVYGGPERGLFGEICRLVKKLPILPNFIPHAQIQPIHVDDLVKGLLAAITQPPSAVLCIAEERGVSFSRFLLAVTRGRTQRFPLFVPVPSLLIRAASLLAGPKLRQSLGLERLESLFSLPQMMTADDLRKLSLSPRSFFDGATRSGRGRRGLFREGRLLLGYIQKSEPGSALLRRYVRCVEELGNKRPLQFPDAVHKIPLLLSVLDNAWYLESSYRSELESRLHIAMFLSEGTRQGASRFLGDEKRTLWLSSVMAICFVLLKETVRRIAQALLFPLFAKYGRNGVFDS